MGSSFLLMFVAVKNPLHKMMKYLYLSLCFLLALSVAALGQKGNSEPYLIVLGIAQDGGVPQAGTAHPGWENAERREKVVSLGIVDPRTSERWMIEATPDFRVQLHMLNEQVSGESASAPDGIFLTHAHIGHYTGLMFLGHESMGASRVPVYAMPQMASFLSANGPWDQLVRYKNIDLKSLSADSTIQLNERLSLTPFLVPHRQEYSEVVGYNIDGPNTSVLFIPDIDSWEEWDAWGVSIVEKIKEVDAAFLDATFFADGEIPGRDMSGFPHPFIRHSMERFKGLDKEHKAKVHFIHLNHTNPALVPGSEARMEVQRNGYRIAEELQIIKL